MINGRNSDDAQKRARALGARQIHTRWNSNYGSPPLSLSRRHPIPMLWPMGHAAAASFHTYTLCARVLLEPFGRPKRADGPMQRREREQCNVRIDMSRRADIHIHGRARASKWFMRALDFTFDAHSSREMGISLFRGPSFLPLDAPPHATQRDNIYEDQLC